MNKRVVKRMIRGHSRMSEEKIKEFLNRPKVWNEKGMPFGARTEQEARALIAGGELKVLFTGPEWFLDTAYWQNTLGGEIWAVA
jgi:hypothetical protein